MAGALDGNPQGPLVLGADPGAAARLDFGPVGNEPPDLLDVLVVNELNVFDAEGANPASRHKPPTRSSAGASSRSAASRPTRWTAPRSSGWASPLRSVRRPVGWGCFRSHTYRFLLNFPVVWVMRLEGQIVGFVIRRLIVSALSSPISAPVSITSTGVVVSAAPQELHFAGVDFERIARLTISVGIASPS